MGIEGISSTNKQYIVKQDVNQQLKASNNANFKQILKTEVAPTIDLESKLLSMIDDIDHLRELMEGDTTVENLKTYKEAVSSLLKYVGNQHMGLERHYYDEGGKEKAVDIAKKIEGKISDMTEDLLADHYGQMLLLEKTGEIQGLMSTFYA